MTASFLGGILWVIFAFIIAVITVVNKWEVTWFFTICGCMDLVGRALGMKSTFYFIPIWILALLGNFLFAGIALYDDHNTVTYSSPPISTVNEITARLYNRPDDGPNLEEFNLPPSSRVLILNALDGAQEDDNPMKWQVLGNLDIALEKQTIEVRLFWTNQSSGAFRINETYYRGSSDEELIRIISDAAKQLDQLRGNSTSSKDPHSTPVSPPLQKQL